MAKTDANPADAGVLDFVRVAGSRPELADDRGEAQAVPAHRPSRMHPLRRLRRHLPLEMHPHALQQRHRRSRQRRPTRRRPQRPRRSSSSTKTSAPAAPCASTAAPPASSSWARSPTTGATATPTSAPTATATPTASVSDTHACGRRRIPSRPGQESAWDYPRPPRLERGIGAPRRRTRRRHDRGDAARVPRARDEPPAELLLPARRRCARRSRGREGRVVLRVEGSRVVLDRPGRRSRRDGGCVVVRDAECEPSPRSRTTSRSTPAAWTRVTSTVRLVTAQPGGFYGGWITANIVGPFKGAARITRAVSEVVRRSDGDRSTSGRAPTSGSTASSTGSIRGTASASRTTTTRRTRTTGCCSCTTTTSSRRRRVRPALAPRHGDRHVGARGRARAPRQRGQPRRDPPRPRAAHERRARHPHSERTRAPTNPCTSCRCGSCPTSRASRPSTKRSTSPTASRRGTASRWRPAASHDAAIRIHQRDATLWVGRLRPVPTVTVPDAPFVHVFVARGTADLDGVGHASARATRCASPTPAPARSPRGPTGAEVTVWETHADARLDRSDRHGVDVTVT